MCLCVCVCVYKRESVCVFVLQRLKNSMIEEKLQPVHFIGLHTDKRTQFSF